MADGAYSSEELAAKAADKNISIFTTNALGRTPREVRASFPRSCCEGCPHQKECLARIKVNTAVVNIPLTSWRRATELASDQDNEFKAFITRLRNGVETIPSILRQKYHVDDLPVRGKLKTKIRFGFKLLALNFSKLWLYSKGLEKCRAFEG